VTAATDRPQRGGSAATPASKRMIDLGLERIAAGAPTRDETPEAPFPAGAFDALGDADLLGWTAGAGPERPPAGRELALVRAVAAADGSVGRIYDGHLNAVERLTVQGSSTLRGHELARFAAGELLGGVWGGDPGPGEGTPAAVIDTPAGPVLRGVKTFCSGAGGLDRALVLARGPEGGPPLSAWVDLTDPERARVDLSWYRSHGLRASVSHRVVFEDLPVIELLGPPGSISAQPWFARDALRTAASWAGMADSAVASALAELATRPATGPLEGLAAGRILAAQHTISVWLAAAATAMDDRGAELPSVALHGRVAIADACRTLLDEAARACGSRPFARGGALDRARRDLEVFLLQHRLDPMLARAGEAALRAHRR
jgi:alkylation response protein AidB-like acyl-CoA dehydrogenase